MLKRNFWLLVHRYAGLLMACFLLLVAVTGSLLAFTNEITHLVNPRFFAKPQPGMKQLDFSTLIDRAEALVPQGEVYWVILDPDQFDARFSPRRNPATGKPYPLDVEDLYLNPWTGQELARRKPGEPYPNALMHTVIRLHEALLLGNFGFRFVGAIALIWTIDCFVAFYLTLPATLQRFWPRWKQAWMVKWRASAARVNFDLHRAGGLWLWPMIFIFAWSGVMFNLPEVYDRVSRTIFHYHWPEEGGMPMPGTGDERPPRLDFHAALSTAQRLMAEQAAIHHFSVMEPEVFAYQLDSRTYFYNAHSSRDIWGEKGSSWTTITFDADTGSLRELFIPTGEHTGRTVALWLVYLHECWFGLPYRIFVCVLGLVIAMLSYTGIYIWWKKRNVRIETARKRQASLSKAAVQTERGTL